jgi:hypothetical protein
MSDNLYDNLKIELYKQLKQEASAYIEKVPALWLQKFTLIGAVIVFVLTGKVVDLQYNYLIGLGFVIIPFLALVLDAKILEFSLHARIISQYIAHTFNEPEAIPEWENLFWGRKGDPHEILLVRIRSFTTVAVQSIPTCLLIMVSCAILGKVWGNFSYCIGFGIIVSVIYLSLIVCMWWLIFIKKKKVGLPSSKD